LEALAAAAGVDAGLLTALGGLTVLPLLLACGQQAAPLVERSGWGEGYCPVCAAWPALAELRGLEKQRWLRCGRCSSGWLLAHDGCVFCGEADWHKLGYLAPEGDTESRRAVTCESCDGYLKTLASLTPLAPGDIAVADAQSLELDMAALERGYARPELPALPLPVTVQAQARRRFFGWR
jgi:FdhE protein